MLKLVRNTSNAEELDKLKGKVVGNVEEFSFDDVFDGPIKAWKGSTESEFFHLLFTNGMLSLCISEREMFLNDDPIGIAMTPALREAVEVSKTDDNKGLELTRTYTDGNQLKEDVENLTFGDVLNVLGWKQKTGAKLFFDNFIS